MIGPLVQKAVRAGDVLSNRWVIHRVERLDGGLRYAVTASPASFRVIVEVPRAGNIYMAEAAGLGVWVESNAGQGSEQLYESVCRELAARLSAFEGSVDPSRTVAAQPVRGLKPTLYLVPGHLGDPDDISVRALQVLASVPLIFVEHGKTDDVRALLTRFELRPTEGPGAPEVVEVGGADDRLETRAVERWRASLAEGVDACLFGANEGVPAFLDPGKALVMAASEMPDAVDVRCVGGSSVLGHVLMRVPALVGAFEFGGHLESENDLERLGAVQPEGRLPLVLFSQGNAVRAHLRELIDRRGIERGTIHLVAGLTRTEEQSIAIDIARFALPSTDQLPDFVATVVVIDQAVDSLPPARRN